MVHLAVIASMKKGLEHFVYRELQLLTARGFSISLFPTKHGPGLYQPIDAWRFLPWNPVTVVLWNAVAALRAPARYMRLLAEAFRLGGLVDLALAWYLARLIPAADVIYATFGDDKLFIGYFCKRITGKPLVVTFHAYELYNNPNPRLLVRALAACDQIVTVTEYNREQLAERYGVDPRRVQVVRLSIDTAEYRPEKRFVILIVGYFSERKGHDVLFQAVKRLGRSDIEVWVVGDMGPDRFPVDVRAQAAAFGVESQVAFFGALSGNALKAVYRACDVFCLPSRIDRRGGREGFPTVLIEAMALGKPVITTRHVEIPRIVDEILVDENDVEGLAQAIERVYQSPHLRARLGEKNRRLAEQVFSTRNEDRMAEILTSVARRERATTLDAPAANRIEPVDERQKA